jgi:hypothetical protein
MVEETLSPREWTSVLELAAMWGMDRLRGIAMEKMRGLTVFEPEEWMKVLDMADMQGLSDARALAIVRLSSLGITGGVAKVQLARKYGVKQWLKEGLQELVQREAFFSDEEEDLLEWKTVSKLYRVRDGYLKSRNSYRNTRSVFGDLEPDSEWRDSYPNPRSIEMEFEAELREITPGWV